MSTTMQFGNMGLVNNELEGFRLIESGYLSGENKDSTIIDLSSHQMYVVYTREITISSGAVRGFRVKNIVRGENGTLQNGNSYSSTNSGVSFTYDDETVTIAPSSTSYDVYYALYAVM